MLNEEREAFILRGQVLEAVRENIDWFIYSPVSKQYIGKVLSRPHSTKGPFIAFFDFEEISDNHQSLESAVDSIARRILINEEAEARG